MPPSQRPETSPARPRPLSRLVSRPPAPGWRHPGTPSTVTVPPPSSPDTTESGHRSLFQKWPRARLLLPPSPPFSLLSSDSWRDLFKTRVRRHPLPGLRPPVAAVLLGVEAAAFATTHTAPLTGPRCHSGSCPATLPPACSAWAANAPGEFPGQGVGTCSFSCPARSPPGACSAPLLTSFKPLLSGHPLPATPCKSYCFTTTRHVTSPFLTHYVSTSVFPT